MFVGFQWRHHIVWSTHPEVDLHLFWQIA